MAVTQIRGNTQIKALTITNAEINASAAIDFSKLAALTNGNILVGDGSNVATSVNPSGDVDISNAGVFSISSNVIVNDDVNASAAIDFSKLATLTDGDFLVGNGSNVVTAVSASGDVTFSNTGVFAIGSGVIVDDDINGSAAIALSKLAEAVIQADGGQAFTADQSMGGFKLTSLGAPSAATDAANKSYVDGVASGLDVKASVRVATTAVLPAVTAAGSKVGKTLTADAVGVLTVDGVATVLTDRILVQDQVAGSDNGIYEVTTEGTGGVPFVLTRATDADEDAEVTAGMFTFIEEGSTQADEGFVLTTNDPITVDTTAQAFSQFSGAGSLVGGDGIDISASTISVDLLSGGGLKFTTGEVGVEPNDFAGDGLEDDGSDNLRLDLKAGGGLKFDTGEVTVEPSDFAGTGLEDDGSDNIRIAASAAGAGLTGGAGSALDVVSGNAGIVVNANDITLTVDAPAATISIGGAGIQVADSTDGKILIGDTAGDTAFQTISGDATLAKDGALSLASNVLKEADIVTREIPTGDLDGVDTTYVLANTPVSGTEHVYLNGILQNAGGNDYAISGTTITFEAASIPQTGDVVLVSYWK